VDLVMTALSTTATSVGAGGSFTLTNTEKNQGTTGTTVGSHLVRFYLSADNVITSADTQIGSRWVGALAAGASSADTTTVTVPPGLAPGTYYLGAIADSDNYQPETNETNNALAGATIIVN
jgi:subtilase family serine protease